MTTASWHGLLAALSLLLDAGQDETARELVLKSHQVHFFCTNPRTILKYRRIQEYELLLC